MEEFQAGQFKVEYETADGQKLWAVLNDDKTVAMMEMASDQGQPALSPVEDILLAQLGETILLDRYKQMAGRMTKQILESRGFVHEASDIRLNSVPFYKASRYRRRDQIRLYLFKNSSNPREICLTETREGEKMPPLADGRWMFVNQISSPLKAAIGYGFDLKRAAAEVETTGHFRHVTERMMRPAT